MPNLYRTFLVLLLVFSWAGMTVSCSSKNIETESEVVEEDIDLEQYDEDEEAVEMPEPEEPEPVDAASEMELEQARELFISEDIFFDKDSYAITNEAVQILERKAQWLLNNPEVNVVIQGHSDEKGNAEYNFALGDRRAGEVKSILIGFGISPSRLAAVTYGRERPVTSGKNEASRAKNRRVHFEIDQ